MYEQTPVTIVSEEAIKERLSAGMITPMHAGEGVQEIDCGDDRPLSAEAQAERDQRYGYTPIPGRYFGGAGGFALTSLVAIGAQYGETAIREIAAGYSAEAFTDFAADLATRARLKGINLNQHSDDTKEGHPLQLADPESNQEALGCKFLAAAGGVIHLSFDPQNRQDIARLLAETGSDMPADEAVEATRTLGHYLPASFGVDRGSLQFAVKQPGSYTPLTIVTGQHAPNPETAVVIDLADYRSSASRHIQNGVPRYHHSPGLAAELLPELLPEYNLEPQLLAASGLVLGMATRTALSGTNPTELAVEIIPADYRAA